MLLLLLLLLLALPLTTAATTTTAAATSYGTRLDTRGSARARHAVRVGMQLSRAVASATAPALECLRPGAPICARKPRRSPEDEKHECLGCFCDLFSGGKGPILPLWLSLRPLRKVC